MDLSTRSFHQIQTREVRCDGAGRSKQFELVLHGHCNTVLLPVEDYELPSWSVNFVREMRME